LELAGSEESAPAEGGESVQRRRWRRIPTPLIITLIGIVLSAWLLPAITRQWDDRQKAHQVKSALVTEMAEANARAFTGARRLLFVLDSTLRQGSSRCPRNRWSSGRRISV
jgi:hypothetical protein